MRANRTLEIGTGLFVLLGFAALLFLTTQLPASGIKFGGAKAGFHVTADFDNIGDLKVGSPVTMAGVRVGDVSAIRFDPQTYKAVVTLRVDPQYKQIPDDTFASIQTQGLLGGKYIGLSPGGQDTYLKDGSHIDQTQSAIVLESLINKFFAHYASKSGSGDNSGQGSDNQGKGTDNQGKPPAGGAPAAAAPAGEGPTEVVQTAAQGMLGQLDKNRDAYRRDPSKVSQLVDKYLLPHFDTERAARGVLGQHWRTATPDQRKRFIDAFYHSLLNNYGAAL